MENSSDESLIVKSLAGDLNAFKTLVVRHEGKVAGIVRSLLGITPLAEDIGQEVFIRFYDELHKYREHSTVNTYLTKIALKLSVQELKKKAKTHSAYEITERVNGHEEQKGLNEQLQNEFSKLDPDVQSVVVLRLVEGFSVEETAELLEVNTSTVLTRLAKAQYNLRNALTIKLKL